MLSFEEQLYNLQEEEIFGTQEKVEIRNTDVLKQIIKLARLLIQVIDTVANKREIDYEDSRKIEEIQRNCIEELKNIRDIVCKRKIY